MWRWMGRRLRGSGPQAGDCMTLQTGCASPSRAAPQVLERMAGDASSAGAKAARAARAQAPAAAAALAALHAALDGVRATDGPPGGPPAASLAGGAAPALCVVTPRDLHAIIQGLARCACAGVRAHRGGICRSGGMGAIRSAQAAPEGKKGGCLGMAHWSCHWYSGFLT